MAIIAVGVVPWSVSIGDLNGDGKPDLAVANNSSNSVSILLNQPTSAPAKATILADPGGESRWPPARMTHIQASAAAASISMAAGQKGHRTQAVWSLS